MRRCFRGFRNIDWTNLNWFERRLSRFFEVYSAFVFKHPWPFILLPTLIGISLSIGFFFRHEFSDATYLYTPVSAQSKFERECIREKWPLIDDLYIPGKAVDTIREAQSIVVAKDGGNILRSEMSHAIYRLNSFITEKITVTIDNQTYNYNDLCLHWDGACYTNAHVSMVSTLYNNPNNDITNLTYPTATFGSSHGYLGSSLGGVKVDNETGIIQSAKAWILLYQLRFASPNESDASGQWELEYEKQLMNYSDPFIRITVYHSQSLSLELKRNAEKLAPRFGICFVVLVMFAMLATFSTFQFPYIDWVVSKPLLALFGVVGAGMGIGTTIGLFAFCGYIYNQIVSVMPFLIIAVRLDNTFLMISALRHVSRSLPAEKRITESMAQAASAITVTVTTDFFSFLAGVIPALSDIPAVRIFCLYTAVAVFITFLFQLTFFMGLLVLAAKNEEKGRNSMLMCIKTVSSKEAKERGWFTRLFNQGSHVDIHSGPSVPTEKDTPHGGRISYWFAEWYAPILTHPIVKGLVLFWFLAYLAVSSYLCTQMREGLEPVKLLVRDSYAIPHYRLLESMFWPNGSEMQLVVNHAPNLANSSELARMKAMINAFAGSNHSMGRESVQFWLYDFEYYMNEMGWMWTIADNPAPDYYYDAVGRFLNLSTYEKLRQDIIWNDVTLENGQNISMITSFRLSMGLTHFENAKLQIDTVTTMRQLASDPRWVDMNITTFNPVWLFVDQYTEILPNVKQEIAFGVCFMILIALLLIPHPFTSLWVAITILSVDVGVIGFMTLWDINLDTISMLTIIMSIGFSVDFAAHVAHAFVCASDKDDSGAEKVKKAMGEVAWPILQGALSTLLGVIVLSDLESYMVVAFFKTVFLVIIIAVLHGLVFLPVLLSIFVPRRCRRKKKSKDNNADGAMNGEINAATGTVSGMIPNGALTGVIPNGKLTETIPTGKVAETVPNGILKTNGPVISSGISMEKIGPTRQDAKTSNGDLVNERIHLPRATSTGRFICEPVNLGV